MKFFINHLFLFIAIQGTAQRQEVQSQINSLYNESKALQLTNIPEAHKKILHAISLSLMYDQYQYGKLLTTLGDIFVEETKFDSAYQCYLEAIPVLKEDDSILGHAYFGKGYVEYYRSQYEKSLASTIQAERIARSLQDKPMLARAVKFMGSLAETEKDYTSSLRYFKEALRISEEINDTLNIIRTLNSLASPYQMSGEFRKCEEILLRAIELGKKLNCNRCLAISYSQLGVTDFYWGKYERSIKYYQMEQAQNRKIGSTYDLFYANQNIAESLVELKRLSEALVYNDSALQIGSTYKVNQFIHDAWKVRYAIYKQLNKYSDALHAFEMQMQYKDSLFNSEKAEITENLRTTFETEQKERKIKELEQANIIKELEATTARQWQYGLLIVLVLLTIVAGVLYNRNQLKQRTAKSLNEKNTELQKLNGFKDRMFAVISHDLRNPVDAFNTIIESLNQNLQHASKEELKEFLESTLESAKDLKSLLNNLLEWSLVQIGKLPFNPIKVSLGEIVGESINHTDSMASVKNILIKNNITDECVMADKSMITIIVRNLLSNAIKFSNPGSSVELNIEHRNGSVVLCVKDEGLGMKKEDVGKLFKQEENVRSIGSSTSKGAGIGLLLCKELVDKNKGRIYVKSAEGEGSTFYLELPVA